MNMDILKIRADELHRGDAIHFPSTIVRDVVYAQVDRGRRFVTVTLSDDSVLTLRADQTLSIEA